MLHDLLSDEEKSFSELRHKVLTSELLSAATMRLLSHVHFSGKLCVVVQNGRVLKSGYEEGYFTNRPSLENARI